MIRMRNENWRIFQLEQNLERIEIVSPPAKASDRVTFGATVTVRDVSGEQSTYRIVGADETDFARGWISWMSPVAKALINARAGETVRLDLPSGEDRLQIVSISYE
jgi:transcription elongation factor GreB